MLCRREKVFLLQIDIRVIKFKSDVSCTVINSTVFSNMKCFQLVLSSVGAFFWRRVFCPTRCLLDLWRSFSSLTAVQTSNLIRFGRLLNIMMSNFLITRWNPCEEASLSCSFASSCFAVNHQRNCNRIMMFAPRYSNKLWQSYCMRRIQFPVTQQCIVTVLTKCIDIVLFGGDVCPNVAMIEIS